MRCSSRDLISLGNMSTRESLKGLSLVSVLALGSFRQEVMIVKSCDLLSFLLRSIIPSGYIW